MQTKVLVVDDSLMVRLQVSDALRDAGFAVATANDGCEALQELERSADLTLIVCDMTMPNMNGLEFLEALRGRKGPNPPVVMLSTEGQKDLMTRARNLGAIGWITKPFVPELFLSIVRKFSAKA